MKDERPIDWHLTDDTIKDFSLWEHLKLYVGIFLFFPALAVIGEGIQHLTWNEIGAFSIAGLAVAVFAYVVNE